MTSTSDSPEDYFGTFHAQWATKEGFFCQVGTDVRYSEFRASYDKLVGQRLKGDVLFCALFEFSLQLQEWKLLDIWSYDARDFN